MTKNQMPPLSYDPKTLKRELRPYYISATDKEIETMLNFVGKKQLNQLFDHLPSEILFDETPKVGPHLGYEEIQKNLWQISQRNRQVTSFVGDALSWYSVPESTEPVASIRGLTTAYTPYQPERSQGTLQTLWIYSNVMAKLTGFEAINASLYDRSTCLFEAIKTATRLVRGSQKIIVSKGIFSGDIEVLETLAKDTEIEIILADLGSEGQIDLQALEQTIQSTQGLAAVVYPQTNRLGVLEPVDEITDICHRHKIKTIAIVDPMQLVSGGLKPPVDFGENGADMIVAEGQHLAIGPNFGGPGLGIFGIRYNPENKLAIRQSAGRYIGRAQDNQGNDCLSMVLSTREQHIRREKATSNICSNQSFVATLVGAAVLYRGEEGMKKVLKESIDNCQSTIKKLLSYEGVELAFPEKGFTNEVSLKLTHSLDKLLEIASKKQIEIGIVKEFNGDKLLKLFFNDTHSGPQLEALEDVFASVYTKTDKEISLPQLPDNLTRSQPVGLPNYDKKEVLDYYQSLGDQNVSPDQAIYPLGSCTMKYNPYINDWAAGLEGFTQVHPQTAWENSQGCLEILYQIQEDFKAITGLPGVVTQPVAGAQGELVGLKMFQAYHRDRGEAETRDIVLIPRSAHGTNPATATMAGYNDKKLKDRPSGIVLVDADDKGQMDFQQISQLISDLGPHIAGIMVTNPNTAGIFENNFHKIADQIHQTGGLVYMDGANMNAIAGWVDLDKLGVDAVHNNLHKTWTIPHGGGGPGDAIVGVSHRLLDYMPGKQVYRDEDGNYEFLKTSKSIGSFHRHHGNFAHKVRTYTYLRALGPEGVKKMSAVAILSGQYLFEKLKTNFPMLPNEADHVTRMHEFIITLTESQFATLAEKGTPKAQAMARLGKIFLDYGLHAPTVAFPEPFGLMIEPTESFSLDELDRFLDVVQEIYWLIENHAEVLTTAPHFTPVSKVDEVSANKNLVLSEAFSPSLPKVRENKISPKELSDCSVKEISSKIIEAHKA